MKNAREHREIPLHSIYADDPTISEILPVFLSNIPKYVVGLESWIERGDWAAAARICHDLKGTAGGYGYPDIGLAAQQLEAQLKGDQDVQQIHEIFNEIRALCERARVVLDQTPGGVPPVDDTDSIQV